MMKASTGFSSAVVYCAAIIEADKIRTNPPSSKTRQNTSHLLLARCNFLIFKTLHTRSLSSPSLTRCPSAWAWERRMRSPLPRLHLIARVGI